MSLNNDFRVAMFTGPERCGIAHYTDALVRAMPPEVAITVCRASFDRLPAAVYAAQGHRLNEADVVHIQHEYAYWGGMGPGTGYFAFLAAIRRPIVMTVHELDLRAVGTRGLPAPVERIYKRWMNRRMFRKPQIRRWLTHAAEVTAGLAALGVPKHRIETLPMPGPEAEPLPSAAEAKKILGLMGRRVLTVFGFLARRKGYDLALQALAHLPADVTLLAAGGVHGADRTAPDTELHALAERLGVGDRFRITGYLSAEQIPVVFAATDLVLAPFREVSGSASLALAQAYARPILAADLPALRDSGAVFFPTGDASALARAAQRLLDAPQERDRLAEASRVVAARHSYQALAQRTMAVYKDVLSESTRRCGDTA